MALYYDLPVFQDVYRMILLLFQYTKDFPREYKFTLGAGQQAGWDSTCQEHLPGEQGEGKRAVS